VIERGRIPHQTAGQGEGGKKEHPVLYKRSVATLSGGGPNSRSSKRGAHGSQGKEGETFRRLRRQFQSTSLRSEGILPSNRRRQRKKKKAHHAVEGEEGGINLSLWKGGKDFYDVAGRNGARACLDLLVWIRGGKGKAHGNRKGGEKGKRGNFCLTSQIDEPPGKGGGRKLTCRVHHFSSYTSLRS